MLLNLGRHFTERALGLLKALFRSLRVRLDSNFYFVSHLVLVRVVLLELALPFAIFGHLLPLVETVDTRIVDIARRLVPLVLTPRVSLLVVRYGRKLLQRV